MSIRSISTRLLTLIFLILSIPGQAQTAVSIRFDEGVDLVSLVWRLAGAKEYNLCQIPEYGEAADVYFADYRNHPAVKYAQRCHRNGIAYDAVASYGEHLLVTRDGVSFNPRLSSEGDTSFDRWTPKQKSEFLELVNDFYLSSNFHAWYEGNKPLYDSAVATFQMLSSEIHYDWFDSFFGPLDNACFEIVLSILVGPHNYGCSAYLSDGRPLLAPVIGCCSLYEGVPFYEPETTLPIVIHEFNHAYCNPLNEEFWPSMRAAAGRVFKYSAKQLRGQAYTTPEIMMNETFVRASVIRYMSTFYPAREIEQMTAEEESNGFTLIRTLISSLEVREKEAERYPTMHTYMPKLVESINSFDFEEFQRQQRERESQMAHFTCSVKNGTRNLPAGSYTVTITFDKPMVPSIALGMSHKGSPFPELEKWEWSNDNQTLNLHFVLEAGKRYGFSIFGRYYTTPEGIPALGMQSIDFSTAK